QIPTAGTTRPMRVDHSCHCVRRPEHHPLSRSNRVRRRVRDKPATQHRRSPGSHETGVSSGGRNPAEQHPIPIHPLGAPWPPRSIQGKMLIAISESRRPHRNSVRYPANAGIIEILGQEPTVLHTNAHSNATGVHTDAPDIIRVPDTSADFHLYAVDWQKDEIRWYFDGFEVARAPTPADMHKPVYILVCLAIGGHWVGRPDDSTHFPAVLTIDWIHAYRRGTGP